MSKMTVREFASKFRTLVGDSTSDTPDDFIINGLNWGMRELPLNPKLHKIFAKHYTKNLDAKGHYKWNLNGDFRRLLDMPYLNFWASTGGEVCKANICHLTPKEFYAKGIPSLMKPGEPCYYTVEQEDDNIFLVFDRPLNIPIVVDYIAYGIPQEVKTMDDTIEISALVENAIMSAMRKVFYYESDDFAFAGAIEDLLDNKVIPELIQEINRRWGNESPIIIGEA